MSPSKTYHLRPSQPFSAHYPLTLADSLMVQLDSVYLYIFSTSSSLTSHEKSHLTNILTRSLSSFFQHPQQTPENLPEVLGTIHDDPTTGYLSVRVTPSSSVPFIVSDRSASSGRNVVRFVDLQPESSFPIQTLHPSIVGPNTTLPPPDATKRGVQALWIQLTFLEGGFVIHLHIHHWIAGAMGAGRLFESWMERARLLAKDMEMDDGVIASLTTIKFGKRSELTDVLARVTVPQREHPELIHMPGSHRIFGGMHLNPILLGMLLRIYVFLLTYLPFLLPRADIQLFRFKPEALRRLQHDIQQSMEEAKPAQEGTGGELTANDCLSALLWSCITRARFGAAGPQQASISDDRASTSSPSSTLMSAVDYKARLSPPLHPNFFGNSNVDAYTTLPIPSLISASPSPSFSSSSSSSSSSTSTSSLGTVAQQIRQTVSSTTDAYVRSFYQLITSRPRILDSQKRSLSFNLGPDLICTSWEHVHQDAERLGLDVLFDHRTTGKGTRTTFETLRCMLTGGVDGVFVVFPAYGRKWAAAAHGKGGAGGGRGAAARETGLEVAVSLKRSSMSRLKTDGVFGRYAEWIERGGV